MPGPPGGLCPSAPGGRPFFLNTSTHRRAMAGIAEMLRGEGGARRRRTLGRVDRPGARLTQRPPRQRGSPPAAERVRVPAAAGDGPPCSHRPPIPAGCTVQPGGVCGAAGGARGSARPRRRGSGTGHLPTAERPLVPFPVPAQARVAGSMPRRGCAGTGNGTLTSCSVVARRLATQAGRLSELFFPWGRETPLEREAGANHLHAPRWSAEAGTCLSVPSTWVGRTHGLHVPHLSDGPGRSLARNMLPRDGEAQF